MEPRRQVIGETDRVSVRHWRLDEAGRLLDILGRPEVAGWLGNDLETELMRDLAQARSRIRSYWERSLSSPLGAWAVVPHGTGVPAGTVVLGELPNGLGEVEIGWHFHPDSHGLGYAAEGARLVLGRGFDGGLREIHAVTHLENAPSQAVCRRLGMADLGNTDRWYDSPSRHFRITRQQFSARS